MEFFLDAERLLDRTLSIGIGSSRTRPSAWPSPVQRGHPTINARLLLEEE